MSCELTNIVPNTRVGDTYYIDEPGKAPDVLLKNIPNDWFTGTQLVVHIGVGIEKTGQNEVKSTSGMKLRNVADRRYHKQMNQGIISTMEYVTVIRDENDTNEYTVPICKALPLSRNFKGPTNEIPTMFIHVMNKDKTKHIYSKEFVTMSKRQPDVLNMLKRGRASEQDNNGSKRQRRSEQLKEMIANHESLALQHKELNKKCKNLTNQNKTMSTLLKTLVGMSNVGMQSSSKEDIINCFRFAIQSVETMHWMKEEDTAQSPTRVRRL